MPAIAPIRISELASKIKNKEQARNLANEGNKTLDLVLERLKSTSVVLRLTGYSGAIQSRVWSVREFGKRSSDYITQSERSRGLGIGDDGAKRVALFILQTEDVLKEVDFAIKDKDFEFWPNFNKNVLNIISSVSGTVANVSSNILGSTWAIWIPIVGIIILIIFLKGKLGV